MGHSDSAAQEASCATWTAPRGPPQEARQLVRTPRPLALHKLVDLGSGLDVGRSDPPGQPAQLQESGTPVHAGGRAVDGSGRDTWAGCTARAQAH